MYHWECCNQFLCTCVSSLLPFIGTWNHTRLYKIFTSYLVKVRVNSDGVFIFAMSFDFLCIWILLFLVHASNDVVHEEPYLRSLPLSLLCLKHSGALVLYKKSPRSVHSQSAAFPEVGRYIFTVNYLSSTELLRFLELHRVCWRQSSF